MSSSQQPPWPSNGEYGAGPYGPHQPPWGYGAGGSMPPPPPNHLAMAIITTLLCCLPFGIASIVFASQVNTKYFAGDYAGAVDASNKAKTWWIVAVCSGAGVLLLYLIFGLAVFSGSSSSSF
jgi:hypothetical protein